MIVIGATGSFSHRGYYGSPPSLSPSTPPGVLSPSLFLYLVCLDLPYLGGYHLGLLAPLVSSIYLSIYPSLFTLCQCALISRISGGTTLTSLPPAMPCPPDPPITALAVARSAEDLGERGGERWWMDGWMDGWL